MKYKCPFCNYKADLEHVGEHIDTIHKAETSRCPICWKKSVRRNGRRRSYVYYIDFKGRLGLYLHCIKTNDFVEWHRALSYLLSGGMTRRTVGKKSLRRYYNDYVSKHKVIINDDPKVFMKMLEHLLEKEVKNYIKEFKADKISISDFVKELLYKLGYEQDYVIDDISKQTIYAYAFQYVINHVLSKYKLNWLVIDNVLYVTKPNVSLVTIN